MLYSQRNLYVVFSFLAFILSASLISCSSPVGDPVEGKRWYTMHNCFACHGKNANDGKGPNIAGIEMNYRQFLNRLRNAKTPIMPEYSRQRIPDQDVADILSWLQSIEKDRKMF